MSALDHEVGGLLREVAREIVMPHFRRLSADQIREKAPGDYVTVADQESEARLTERLARLLPEARVIGEEACAADASLLDGLDQGVAWIVDPIDGTTNYSEGIEPFAIMVALIADGVTQAGWILDPVGDTLFHASVGKGAFVDGERITTHASGTQPPRAALAFHYLPADVRADFAARTPGRLTEVAIPRCAGAQYQRLVTGVDDATLYCKMLPWDHAPGALILTEAGGRIAHYDGAPYRPAHPGNGLIAAATPELWDLARDVLVG
jgi:fructose-1,6-bisphosphatase/inositol monophosphatase family enzyme